MERREALLQFYSFISILLHFIFFHSFNIYVHLLSYSDFLSAYPQIIPGKPLIMFASWWVRSSVKLSFWQASFSAFGHVQCCDNLAWVETIQHSADIKRFSCPYREPHQQEACIHSTFPKHTFIQWLKVCPTDFHRCVVICIKIHLMIMLHPTSEHCCVCKHLKSC